MCILRKIKSEIEKSLPPHSRQVQYQSQATRGFAARGLRLVLDLPFVRSVEIFHYSIVSWNLLGKLWQQIFHYSIVSWNLLGKLCQQIFQSFLPPTYWQKKSVKRLWNFYVKSKEIGKSFSLVKKIGKSFSPREKDWKIFLTTLNSTLLKSNVYPKKN